MSTDNAGIDRRPGLSAREFVDRYANPGKPVVVPDATKHWAAHSKWSLDWLAGEFGAHTLDHIDTGGRHSGTLGEFCAQVANSSENCPAPYLTEYPIDQELPALLEDIMPLPLAGPAWLNNGLMPRACSTVRSGSPELLIGGPGARFPRLHYDFLHTNATITQIVGRKQFWLAAPDQGRYFYPDPRRPNLSCIDCFDPVDAERFPDYTQASVYSVVVEPGESIFIPAGWWHRTLIMEPSIAVSFNSVNRGNWQAFSRDWVAMNQNDASLRTRAKIAYMRLVGSWLGVVERLRGPHL